MTIKELLRKREWLWIAHRGASTEAPENTLPAFQIAIEAKMDMIELDVQLTKDGQLVVLHDASLERTTTGRGLVSDATLAEIRKLDAGRWFSEAFANVRVPTLDDVFESFPYAFFNVELKPTHVETADLLTRQVLRCIASHGATNRVLVSSFDHVSLHTLRTLSKDIALGALYSGRMWPPFAMAELLQLSSLHPNVESLDRNVNLEARLRGYSVLTWTVQDENQLHHAAEFGAHGVFVDDVSMKPVYTKSRLMK